MPPMLTVDVLIPVYRPGKQLEQLLERLHAQNCPIGKIILMNTEKAYFPEELEHRYENLEVHHLTKARFDHGGTRDEGIRMSEADVVVCMTQDALPENTFLLSALLKAFSDPEESRIKSAEDLPELGVKTFFCSNVCAAWRRDTYLKLGGFEKKTIFNEDMIFAGRLIQAGGKIAYCADARVIHSHNYHAVQQFHRYFDLAVSQTMHPEVFGGVRSESEGMRLVVKSIRHCMRIGRPWLIFTVVAQNAGKFLGYRLGRRFQKLPRRLVRSFWLEESE